MERPRSCWGLGCGHVVVFSNNEARVMDEDNIRFYRKHTAHVKVLKTLDSYLNYLKVPKVSS
jgi:hypothetical protein